MVLMAFERPAMSGLVSWLVLGLLVLMIGLRFEVGGDWDNYLRLLDHFGTLTFPELIRVSDPGYYLVNWFAHQIGAGIWVVNLVCAGLFAAGLIRFCQRMPEPFLALAVATPYMVIVLGMGYTRQAAAFGLLLWGLVYLLDRKGLHFVITIGIAAAFHKSAILMLPLAALAATEKRVWAAVWVCVAGVLFYRLFLDEQAQTLWASYVESDYAFASEGGPIRVLMNLVPAVVLLALYRRFPIPAASKRLWLWMSVFSIAAFPLVFQAPTAVDRVALYLMPIQLVVWSYLPGLFVHEQRAYVRLGLLASYAAVLLVWLIFATHAFAWLPYRIYPLAQTY
jgi:hypothetical protein